MIIKIKHLSKSYFMQRDERVHVLEIDDFEVKSGQFLVIHGPSGCGKTTLLNLISGILLPEYGNIFVYETDITKLKESKRDQFRAEKIGYLFQNFNLFMTLSVEENILVPLIFSRISNKKTRKDRLNYLLDMVELKHRRKHLASQLSVGEQQRLAMARALSTDAQLILADEPFSNIDENLANRLLEKLSSVCKENNKTLLMVSHQTISMNLFETIFFDKINKLAMEKNV